jgi:hypothetical protein
MDEARRPPPAGDGPGSPGNGSGNGFGTGNPYLFIFRGRAGSLFQGTAASDPFGDAHAESRNTDVDVNDVARVDMSAYQDEATDGRL